ncbi:thiamine diphosphokinase [Natronincola ferrireducens]|uniref:Thiamine diphosphokinase n=1 Tax=Natronincola ferrireducens TaxID=393762 RepID=A0A1G9BUW1_9FIRM|nr:thiamine diphosphokinase [Natronincola ferrireducens]SDK43258.1 thiamine diphosphokinase [Natronincola ferrireducens]
MEVIIIANGDIEDLEYVRNIATDKYIICADGAAKYLTQLLIIPNLLVGDLDSIASQDLDWMMEKGVNFKKFPTRKDQTDTELAVEYALDLQPKAITIIGALGSRQDHSLANVMLLWKILNSSNNSIKAKIINEKNEIMITNSTLSVRGEIGEVLSIIPLTDIVKGVTLKGLEYPLENKDIVRGSTLGVSNVFATDKAYISIEEGILIIIKSRD